MDIFIGYIFGLVCQDSRPPTPQPPKGISKIEILLVKIFSLKQKKQQNQILSATIEKIKFLLSKKTLYGSFFR